ncbi:hypothetical protein GDO78_002970 [Eleutherodactylus coqui]|uniref:RING-type domain-containing protein n=1 Tax=Eleutherodactylus coqui TaxID=57060 RepID=A0A8J6K057_ELECQ|nr:hypothetical protein GDO78_002970 [Eleutherodactylus coqui]
MSFHWRVTRIENLPRRVITSQEAAESCVICMTEFKIGEEVTVLPCDHKYHHGCISPWLASTPRCPFEHNRNNFRK